MRACAQAPAMPALLASGDHAEGARLAELAVLALGSLGEGRSRRDGAFPRGGPDAVAARVLDSCGPALPECGMGDEAALKSLITALSEGAADPSHPWCSGHLHCQPVAVAVAADLAATALNPSLDSWDQAPAASVLEHQLLEAVAALAFPEEAGSACALPTTGGTESNLLALLLARERFAADPRPLRVLVGAAAHHSVTRGAWILGLPAPTVLAGRGGVIDPVEAARALDTSDAPTVLVATAGTTDSGAIDPLGLLGEMARASGAAFHVDAAYGGALLLSDHLRARLAGVEAADTVTLDLHKLGWQPIGAGVLAVRAASWTAPLGQTVQYLNAPDDVAAGQPDLLGRSLRTSRRADLFGAAVTFRALGRRSLGALVEACVARAADLERHVARHPRLRSSGVPPLTTVLLRPVAADDLAAASGAMAGDHLVGQVRRRLLDAGVAVLGRADQQDDSGRVERWLKLTVLGAAPAGAGGIDLVDVLDEVVGCAEAVASDQRIGR